MRREGKERREKGGAATSVLWKKRGNWGKKEVDRGESNRL
jgi:hypothetical protein